MVRAAARALAASVRARQRIRRGGIAYVAIIDLKAIPRPLRPPFVSPLGRFVAALLLCAPRSLGAAIYSYRRHIRSIISKGVSTARLGEPRKQEEEEEEEEEDGGEGCFAGGKIFLKRRLRARPLRTSPILPFLFSSLPFRRRGRSPNRCLRFS